MFTGLVEELGEVVAVKANQLEIAAPLLSKELKIGDSLAVNGVCLTVIFRTGTVIGVEVMPETWRRTNLGRLRPGIKVNLEGALRLGDRLGGHLVTGHVDGIGIVREMRREGNALVVEVTADPALLLYVVPKGSIALDGISLTVVEVTGEAFTVSLIPHTLEVTNLKDRRSGDSVNLEVDIIGKYVRRFLENWDHTGRGSPRRPGECSPNPGLTPEFLARHGYL